MALRLVELYLPADYDGAEAWHDGHPFVARWSVDLNDDGRLLRVLLKSADTEAFLEDIEEELGDGVDYRVVLLPVEASLPRETDNEEAVEREGKTERINREELYEDVVESIRGGHVYLLLVALSTIVAAAGIVRDDVAIIVGAMVIAPLIGPNIALALGATLGDTSLLWKASKINLLGLAVSLVLSVGIGASVDFSPATDQIAARTEVDLGVMAVALSAGVAGALSVTRGVSAALIGVMVAVALLPPIVALGMLIGAQYWLPAYGVGLLLLVNITSINLGAIVTFIAQGVRPTTWYEAEEAKKSTRLALAIWIVVLAALIVAIVLAPSDLIPGDAE